METIMIILGGSIMIAAILLYSAWSWGYVTYKFWMWFLLPVFPQMPHITLYQAMGICIFISLFRNHSSISIKDEYRDKSTEWGIAIVSPWLVLMTGYLIYWWIN